MQRRNFLGHCLIAPLALPLSAKSALSPERFSKIAYLAAAQSRLGEHSVVALNHNGEPLKEHSLPSRGHSFAHSNNGNAAVIARRPADFCLILDSQAELVAQIQAQENRHFYGHGVFDLAGEFLYLSENDFANNRGVVGVYQASKQYRRIAEFDSHGIGPHEITLNADGSQLIVANGGIETHPATGRKKLNLHSMQPSLAYIDRATGNLLSVAQLPPEHHNNSIRHMAVAANNTVYLAMQNQNSKKPGALLGKAEFGKKLIEKISLPNSVERKLDNYVGDIALDQSQQFLLATSPYGNTLLVHNTGNGQSSIREIADICAVTNTIENGEFIATSGDGKIFRINCGLVSQQLTIEESLVADFGGRQQWDNHILAMT